MDVGLQPGKQLLLRDAAYGFVGRVTYGITSFLGILLLHNHDLRLVYESAPQSYEKKLNSHQFSVVCFTELSEKKVPYKSTNDEERND